MKKSVVAAMVLLPLALGTCTWLAKTSTDAVRPVVREDLGDALTRAAQAAQGQRLLVVVAKPGTAASGAIYDSSKFPGGWGAYPPTADPADPLVPALDALAKSAAEEFARDTRFSAPTIRALGIFGVAVVVVTDGANVVMPQVGERDPSLGVAIEVPAYRVRHAEPAFLFLNEREAIGPADPAGFARALRFGSADMRGVEDHAPWGGNVIVEAAQPSQYLLSWPAHGAIVSVDGAPAQFRAARVPMLVVSTPAGRHEISVRYGEERSMREWLVIAAAFIAVASAIALWLGLRPQVAPAEDAAA